MFRITHQRSFTLIVKKDLSSYIKFEKALSDDFLEF